MHIPAKEEEVHSLEKFPLRIKATETYMKYPHPDSELSPQAWYWKAFLYAVWCTGHVAFFIGLWSLGSAYWGTRIF